ncbi:MAG: cytochrome d ubiquinol oxidase subunit II [Bacteroidales bacterium]|jgi:cytochrome d ubiquinol oxidase subunit II|nr:cytochrome d ubiquinol oxidase subunit II [Bacteroidales bacterium]
MTYIFLQQYWWLIVSLLGAILVSLFFVQGGQSVILSLSKKEEDRVKLIGLLGSKWEITFTTLVTFGGAFFASFPLFYSTSFGGAYWAWMLLLLCFVLQAVSYEFQKKKGNLFGSTTYRVFLMINGLLAPILVGVVVGTFFTGANFTVSKEQIYDLSNPIISVWNSPWHGLEALWSSPLNLLLGAVVLFLSRVLAMLYILNRAKNKDFDDAVAKKMKKRLWIYSVLFVFHFLLFLYDLLTMSGYAVNPSTSEIFIEPYKYFHNFLQMPAVSAILLVGVVLVLYGCLRTLFSKKFGSGIWFAGSGAILAVLSLLLVAGWNNTAYYPSLTDPQSSLTIFNSSSSYFTLNTMFYVSLLVPFVIAYIAYTWKVLARKETK